MCEGHYSQMGMKKKLLLFHPIIAPYRIDMVNELAEQFDLTLCLSAHNLKNQKFDIDKLYAERLRVKPEYLNEKDYNGRTNVLRAACEAIKNHEPDSVLVSEFNPIAWAVILYRILHHSHYKIISLVDDSWDMILREKSLVNRHALARRFTMPLLDQVVCVNTRVQEWYRNKYSKGVFFPIVSDEVVYRERLQRVLPISEEYVAKYKLQGKKVLLFVGRLYKDKNIQMAIEAFLQARIENSVFLIVGDGADRESLERRFGNEKSVILLGRYEGDALYAWYNVAQVFILPSTREPFGAVTNEALMAGCYVLLSDVAGSACLIEKNINGNCISPDSKDGMSIQIAKSLGAEKTVSLPLKLKSDRMIKPFREYINHLICAM